ncbi:MAG: sodium/proton-translocating pyrophosphatase, partial [Bacteroidota bacterium]
MNNIVYLIPVLGLVGIIVMIFKSAWVSKQDAGDDNMQELAGHIAHGAMAFLKAEWKVLSYFVVIAGLLLAYSGTLIPDSHPLIALAFVIGAVFSAFALVAMFMPIQPAK